jgi:hypothetical protein
MLEIFDLTSIESNKDGKKSDLQIKEIKEAANPGIWLYGGLGVLLLGGCSYAAMSQMGGSSALSFLGILLAGVGLFAALRGFTTWNLRRKLLQEPVQSAEGTVSFKMKNAVAQLIEADHFSAETKDGKVLHPIGLAGVNPKLPPGNYRFYYLNTRSWLLASEPLFDEAQMRTNLNAFLATALGYDLTVLENSRTQARLGQIQTVEGLPQIEYREPNLVVPDELQLRRYYCLLGENKFEISDHAKMAIFENLPHRAYYHEDHPNKLVALEIA